MEKTKKFSIAERVKSFSYAFAGLITFFKEEHNALIHLLATIIVACLVFILPVSQMEIIILIIVISMVWITELINTAIEKIIDFISTEQDARIKKIKDLTAAAVLVAAITAFVTGCIIFIPKL